MNAADLLNGIIEATIAITLALLLVLPLRKPLRDAFGAGVAYKAWVMVPIAMIAVLLPARTVATASSPGFHVLGTQSMSLPALAGAMPAQGAQWLCGIWLAGMLLMALRLRWLERSFRHSLGSLHRRADGMLQAEVSAGLPAVYGLWRPTIVVPADFDLRYSGEERRLMQAHERSHVASGDLLVNAMVAVLRSLFWFNPLLHAVARRFRHDQELACDQRVISSHPQSRRSYGEAMFKTQLAARPLPLGCHWGYGHPLKERIAMLKQPIPTRARVLTGSALMLALSLGVGLTAWATQPAQEQAKSQVAPGATGEPSMPEDVQGTPPLYPKLAVDQKLSGKVVLLVDVAADGRVTGIVVESSRPAGVFDAAAIEAAWQWKFKPNLESGKAVAGRVRVPVDFRIPANGDGAGEKPLGTPLASR
ncbi:energy transducer TonB [Pseudoxanthomonas yeongjuensis]|uniref:TonB family protein n=1 Tax=Pseudoxanthomonas yeongjuensis TaxID=377616 RepID=UPI0013907A4C|nr:TonB family protein [Pseudoxanthomonas yeongjuensis]KAF1716149.1 energy transducer TonB [Pseudoxanthomonas yeongjuensis]